MGRRDKKEKKRGKMVLKRVPPKEPCGCMMGGEEAGPAPTTLKACTGRGCGPTPYIYQPSCVGGNCRDDIPTAHNPNTVVSQSPTFTALSTSTSSSKLSGVLSHHSLMNRGLDDLQASINTSTGDDLANKFRHCIKTLANAHHQMNNHNHEGASAMSGTGANHRQIVNSVLESNADVWNSTIVPATNTAKATLQQMAQLAIQQGVPCSYVNTLYGIIDKNGDQAQQVAVPLRDHLMPYLPILCQTPN